MRRKTMSNKRDFYIPRIEENNEEVGTVTKARSNNSTYDKFASSFSNSNERPAASRCPPNFNK